MIVGVRSVPTNGDNQIDFWLIPTLYIEHKGQKSLSINKIPRAKNNWDLLMYCRNIEDVLAILK